MRSCVGSSDAAVVAVHSCIVWSGVDVVVMPSFLIIMHLVLNLVCILIYFRRSGDYMECLLFLT